jgi:prefoldin subunit 5|tara:strand:+ start:32 stop:217 length:186 start_codon:yes stop_codon:yes gene_type:complete
MVNNNEIGVGMTTLKDRLEELMNQQKQMEANFHQITGAIALVNQMMQDEDNGKEDKKEPKK